MLRSECRRFSAYASTASVLLVLVMSFIAAGCQTIPMPPPKPGAWLVYLCKTSDAAQEPHTLAFYQELFDSNRRDLLFDYFQDASNGKIDLSGTEVYGWFTMTVTTAVASARNNTTTPNRTQTAQDCKSAGAASFLANGKSIDPGQYSGFIGVINVTVDVGQAGQGALVANQNETVSFFDHEMLHVFGLPHSFVMSADLSQDHSWNSGADAVYFDCWDIMSFATCTFRFNTGPHGQQGPELQIAYRQKLGWVPASRVLTKDAADPSPSTIVMAPVSEPSRPGTLLTRIALQGGDAYGIEYRAMTGFDRGVPGGAVVIRELRRDGLSYLVTRQDGRIDWTQGDRFTDIGNFLSITVDAITPQSATITIDPRFSAAANLGDICGNKFVGEVRQCAPGTTCGERRSKSCSGWWIFSSCTWLVSTDYFCQ